MKRKFLSLLFVFGLLTLLSGCAAATDKEGVAKKVLNEKYNEDFTIFTYGERFGSLTGNTFKVIAAPADNENLKFEAKVHNNGSFVFDGYMETLLEHEIETIISEELEHIADNYLVDMHIEYVKDVFKDKESVSLEKFIELNPNSKYIHIIIDEDTLKVEPQQEYLTDSQKNSPSSKNVKGDSLVFRWENSFGWRKPKLKQFVGQTYVLLVKSHSCK